MQDAQFGECRQSTAVILEEYGVGSLEELAEQIGWAMVNYLLAH